MLDLDAIKARLALASPDRGRRVGYPPDADLKNHAHDDLAALVAEVERLRHAIQTHERIGRRMSNNPHDRDLWAVLDA